jgi:hypothetical protein
LNIENLEVAQTTPDDKVLVVDEALAHVTVGDPEPERIVAEVLRGPSANPCLHREGLVSWPLRLLGLGAASPREQKNGNWGCFRPSWGTAHLATVAARRPSGVIQELDAWL